MCVCVNVGGNIHLCFSQTTSHPKKKPTECPKPPSIVPKNLCSFVIKLFLERWCLPACPFPYYYYGRE